MRRLFAGCAVALAASLLWGAAAWAQSHAFQAGENPVSNQAYDGIAVIASDTTVIPVTRALWNGNATACNIAVKSNAGHTVTYANVPSGSYLLVQAIQVLSTGTTCSSIVALY